VCLMGLGRRTAGIGLGLLSSYAATSASALNRIRLRTLIAGQD